MSTILVVLLLLYAQKEDDGFNSRPSKTSPLADVVGMEIFYSKNNRKRDKTSIRCLQPCGALVSILFIFGWRLYAQPFSTSISILPLYRSMAEYKFSESTKKNKGINNNRPKEIGLETLNFLTSFSSRSSQYQPI